LINLMKQETFDKDSDLYGRIAYKVNPEFGEVKALAWVLARYVVESETASIVEELIPITWPVYSDGDPGIDESVWDLPSKGNIESDELQEHLDYLYEDRENWQSDLQDIIHNRKNELETQRSEFKEKLLREGQSPDWLEGIDELTVTSNDVLAITLLFPR